MGFICVVLFSRLAYWNEVDFILLIIVLGHGEELVGANIKDLHGFVLHRLEICEGREAEPGLGAVALFKSLFQLSCQLQLRCTLWRINRQSVVK